jgi:uncharacterized membrane protein
MALAFTLSFLVVFVVLAVVVLLPYSIYRDSNKTDMGAGCWMAALGILATVCFVGFVGCLVWTIFDYLG